MLLLGIVTLVSSFLPAPLYVPRTHPHRSVSLPTAAESEDALINQLKELARTTSQDPMAIVQAAQLHDQQQQSLVQSPHMVNLILEIYAYSIEGSAAQQAQELLETIREPETSSIALVMEGWIQKGQVEQVAALYETYATDDNDMILFHKLLKAYGRAGQPAKAYELLQERVSQQKRVDQKAWIHMLRAYRSEPNTIEKLIGDMMQGFRQDDFKDWFPSIEAYNVLLWAYRDDAEEAEKLLYELISQSKNGSDAVRPTAESFYHVLQAFAKQKQPSAFKVETILQLQKALGIECTPQCLQTALFVVSKSRDYNKAQKASKYLQQLGDEANTNSYSNVLAACAYTSPLAKPEDKLAAFTIALDMFGKLTQGLDQNGTSWRPFVLMLRCCEILMKNRDKRDAMVGSVFRQCCDAGVVNEKVLKALSKAGSETLQLQLLNGFVEDGFNIPLEWRRNMPAL